MTIQEILEDHKRIDAYEGPATCSCEEWESRQTGLNSIAQHRAHVAEVLDKHMQEREAEAVRETATLMTPVSIGYQNLGQRATIRRCQTFLLERANKIKEDTTNGR